MLTFSVLGIAVPFVRVGPINRHGNVHENAKLRHWKSQIADAALDEIKRTSWTKAKGAVVVSMEFVLVRRPTKTRRPKLDLPISGKSVGDLDSYIRPVGDAMKQAGVYQDDMLIVEFTETRKRWQRHDEEFAGVVVRVEIVE